MSEMERLKKLAEFAKQHNIIQLQLSTDGAVNMIFAGHPLTPEQLTIPDGEIGEDPAKTHLPEFGDPDDEDELDEDDPLYDAVVG